MWNSLVQLQLRNTTTYMIHTFTTLSFLCLFFKAVEKVKCLLTMFIVIISFIQCFSVKVSLQRLSPMCCCVYVRWASVDGFVSDGVPSRGWRGTEPNLLPDLPQHRHQTLLHTIQRQPRLNPLQVKGHRWTAEFRSPAEDNNCSTCFCYGYFVFHIILWFTNCIYCVNQSK